MTTGVPSNRNTGSAVQANTMMTILGDLRLALRGLRRSPLFATVAILSLALGIGANTAIFTLIDQLLLRKLPVRAPDELVMLYQQGPHNGSNMFRTGGRRLRSMDAEGCDDGWREPAGAEGHLRAWSEPQ